MTAITNPFDKSGIMSAFDMHTIAYLSLAKASLLPELKKTDVSVIERRSKNAIKYNTPAEYINRLMNASRRNQELQPVVKAIADQFSSDVDKIDLNPFIYKLIQEYGATECYFLLLWRNPLRMEC